MKGVRKSKNVEDKRLLAIKGRPERPKTSHGATGESLERTSRWMKDYERIKGYIAPKPMGAQAGFKSMEGSVKRDFDKRVKKGPK